MKYEKKRSLALFTAGEEGYSCFRIPSVITLPDGRVLAFAEGRRNGLSDSGAIDIVEKISLDGGDTFGPLRVAVSGGENTAGNQCPVYDRDTGKVVMIFNRNYGDGPEHMILRGRARRFVSVTESADMGETWAEERDVTNQTMKPLWTWHAVGPCHALQLPSGRLVVPCNHAELKISEGKSGPYISHTLYSDDHGANWLIGRDIELNTNECTLALLKDGRLLMNMRNFEQKGCRGLAVSENEGESFAGFHYEPALPEPCCQGAMLTVEHSGKEYVLFSNPADSAARVNLMIHESADGGASWQEGCVVNEGASAYSDMTELRDGRIAVLYECGGESPYEKIEWTVYELAD